MQDEESQWIAVSNNVRNKSFWLLCEYVSINKNKDFKVAVLKC